MNSVLSCQQLSKSFSDVYKKITVLDDVHFEIASHQAVAILGASGTGKSTLLHLLGGLDYPSSGTVLWEGREVSSLSEKEKCRLRNKHLGFIYQFHHLLPEFTALENVALPLLVSNIKAAIAQQKARVLLERVGLGNRLHHRPGELSGGERQRVAIARALINTPRCVLADEPTGNLDAQTAEQVLEVMLTLQKTSATSFVIVTHNIALAARLDACYRLIDGKLVKEHIECQNPCAP